ncbi:MAG TPA: helix-turn-helix domain-containing protein, partial [Pyrinomonadaceae bacterium]|nr:helix-turn-helix domain-containing protein [Pyrinomonadaceae bacterium]
GNVRELKNTIERAVVLGGAEFLMPEDLPESIIETEKGPPPNASSFFEGVKEAKKRLILNALEEAGGNYTEAAKRLDMYPTYLHRLMKNLGLKEDRK